MDKKDIYEHLAKIYLDASVDKKKKSKKDSKVFKNPFVLSIIIIVGLSIFFSSGLLKKNRSLNSEIALILQPDIIKINFHFDPAKKEIYSLGLNTLDLSKFKTLSFCLKKTNYQDNISLRIEFTSAFKEKSEVYLKDIPQKWQDYRINLSNFKNISDWSNMLNLSFIVEQWNTKGKKGIIYLDNIRLSR